MAWLGHQCKARFAGNGYSLAKKRNTAVMAQMRPNVNIISTCPLKYTEGLLIDAWLYSSRLCTPIINFSITATESTHQTP
jgi:hypothetical protein